MMRIEGTRRLFPMLDRIATDSLAEPMQEVLSVVQNAARTLAPEDSGNLRDSIHARMLTDTDGRSEATATGEVYTECPYAYYMEYGTGPKGAAHHEGIAPDETPSYRPTPWWIHIGNGEGDVARETALKYGWLIIRDHHTGEDFALCEGNPAYPFMYPALADHKNQIMAIFALYLDRYTGGER